MKKAKAMRGFLCIGFILLIIATGCRPVGEETVLTDDGLIFAFSDNGSGEETIILVHGWSNDRSIWVEQIPYLESRHRVIAVDLPGFGQSGFDRTDWSMEAYGGDILALIDQLDLKEVLLVGFSMGVAPCMEAARSEAGAIKGVVIVEQFYDPDAIATDEEINGRSAQGMQLVANDGEDFPNEPNHFFRTRLTEARELVKGMMGSRINRDRIGWRESGKAFHHWTNDAGKTALREMKVPIDGIYSTASPVNEAAFKEYNPTVSIHYIPDAAHVVQWDNPAAFNRLLDELAEQAFSD